MAGSRKGERRGGAKPGHVSLKPKTVAKPDSPRARIKRRAPKRSEEYFREVTAMITGDAMKRRDEPRDAMWEAMQYFLDGARAERRLFDDMRAQLANCRSDAEFKMIGDMLENSTQRIKELYQLTLDAGFKVAPYVHAKLSSIEISGPDKGPIEIIGMLLSDIEKANAGRPTWAPPELELEAERLEP